MPTFQSSAEAACARALAAVARKTIRLSVSVRIIVVGSAGERRREVAAEHQVIEHPPIPDVPQDEEELSAVAAHFAARRREVEAVVAADIRQRTVAADVHGLERQVRRPLTE